MTHSGGGPSLAPRNAPVPCHFAFCHLQNFPFAPTIHTYHPPPWEYIVTDVRGFFPLPPRPTTKEWTAFGQPLASSICSSSTAHSSEQSWNKLYHKPFASRDIPRAVIKLIQLTSSLCRTRLHGASSPCENQKFDLRCCPSHDRRYSSEDIHLSCRFCCTRLLQAFTYLTDLARALAEQAHMR